MPSPELDLVIVGAPRSGTNMLRDVLCRLPGFGTWPCDEINYVWRHGNARWPSDALPPERAAGRPAACVRRAFARRRRAGRLQVVVEKTCANSLRVRFVDRILPQARYVFIHRDPLDAVASAMARWRAPFELGYTLAKARFVPRTDLPYYALHFLRNRLHRLLSRQGRLAFWGPRLDDMDAILRRHSLAEVCALQWRECVVRAAEALVAMPQERIAVVRYEDFVRDPDGELSTICGHLGVAPGRDQIEAAVAGVSARSIGKGAQALADDDRRAIERITLPAEAALQRLLARRASGGPQRGGGSRQTRDRT